MSTAPLLHTRNHFSVVLCRIRTSTTNLRTRVTDSSPEALSRGQPCPARQLHRSCQGCKQLQRQKESTLPGGCSSQGGKPQCASRVVPQSKGDKRLPALGGFHLCCDKQTKKTITIYCVFMTGTLLRLGTAPTAASCVRTEAEKGLQAC